MKCMRFRFLLMCVLFAVCLSGLASAQPPVAATSSHRIPTEIAPTEKWRPVGDARLGMTRGGFETTGGLLASFGFGRQVYLNGNLISTVSVDIPDVGNMSAQQAEALRAATGGANVVQIGPGNSIDPTAFTQTAAAGVIQNTLNGQSIQAVTTLNLGVSNLDLLHSINLANGLQAATIGSLGH